MLPGVELQESDLLQKQEKLLCFIRNTQWASRKWRETYQALAPMLGLDSDGLTIQQLKELFLHLTGIDLTLCPNCGKGRLVRHPLSILLQTGPMQPSPIFLDSS
jgi:hypothetical protein